MIIVDYTKDKNPKIAQPFWSIKKETDTYTEYWLDFPEHKIISYKKWNDPESGLDERIVPARQESTKQKHFLAVGGKYAGKWIPQYEAYLNGYVGFNSAGYGHHSKIWVYTGFL